MDSKDEIELGKALLSRGSFKEALHHFMAANPEPDAAVESGMWIGIALTRLERYAESLPFLTQARTQRPTDITVRINLAGALSRLGRLNDALQELLVAQALAPDNPDVARWLSRLLNRAGRAAEAAVVQAHGPLRQAMAHFRRDGYPPFSLLAPPSAQTASRPIQDAMRKAFMRSYEEQGDLTAIYAAAGDRAYALSHPDVAADMYQRAIVTSPDESAKLVHATNYFTCLMLSPHVDTPTLSRAIRSTIGHVLPDLRIRREFGNDPDPERRIRVGYFCQYTHVEHFETLFAGGISMLDPAQFEVSFFADGPVPPSFAASPVTWINCANKTIPEIAPLVSERAIDVIQDLNGYSGLQIFALALKLAPVQIGGANWCTTTGLDAFDYVLGAQDHPDDAEAKHYTERVYRYPSSRGAVRFPDYFPRPAAAPCLAAGVVTYGCFGQSHKVNPETIALWARVLRQTPGARLFLKSNAFKDDEGGDLYRSLFDAAGVSPDRLILEPPEDYRSFLQNYARIDIALDTIPHNGGNTTFEALRSGVPVVTLRGSRFNSQWTAHLLKLMGLPELVAFSEQEYVEIAVALAHDPDRIARYRSTVAERLLRSPYCDIEGYGRDLATMYRSVWRTWCEEQGAREYRTDVS